MKKIKENTTKIMKKTKENIAEILFTLGFINIDIAFFMKNSVYGLFATGTSLIILGLLVAISQKTKKR